MYVVFLLFVFFAARTEHESVCYSLQGFRTVIITCGLCVANIQLMRSRMAPKIILTNARMSTADRDRFNAHATFFCRSKRHEKGKEQSSYNSTAASSLNAAGRDGMSSDFAWFKQMLMLTRGAFVRLSVLDTV